jgi:hypothetical protein
MMDGPRGKGIRIVPVRESRQFAPCQSTAVEALDDSVGSETLPNCFPSVRDGLVDGSARGWAVGYVRHIGLTFGSRTKRWLFG